MKSRCLREQHRCLETKNMSYRPKMCRKWPKICKKKKLPKYYDLKWNFELGGLLNYQGKKAYFNEFSWGRPPRPRCQGLYPNMSTSRHFMALQTAACAPYSSQIPSYSESCGQPCAFIITLPAVKR